MSWFKVDDGLHSHPKWTAASLAARGLWATAGSWCADQLTDGFVPHHMVPLFGARQRDADELVRVGLWERVEGGWQFHEWHSDADGTRRNPTKDEVESERAAARDRQRRARERSRESRRDARRDARRDTPRDISRASRREFGPPDPSLIHTARGDARTYDPPAIEPPPRRCPDHQDVEHPPPCGACADARRTHDTWQARQEANGQRTPDGDRFLPGSGRLSEPSALPDPPAAAPDWGELRDKVRHPHRSQEEPT